MSEHDTPEWLQRQLDTLSRDIPPARDLWPAIDARLGGVPHRRRWPLAVAAAVVITTATALITWQAMPPGENATGVPPLLTAEWLAPYEQARALHQARWNDVRGHLDPDTAAVVERNLAIIRAATTELAEALGQAPQDATTRALLDRTLAHELALYQQVSQLALDSRVPQHAL